MEKLFYYIRHNNYQQFISYLHENIDNLDINSFHHNHCLLTYICKWDRYNILLYLLSHKIKSNVLNINAQKLSYEKFFPKGNNALMYICSSEFCSDTILNSIFNYNCDINLVNNKGYNSVMNLCKNVYVKVDRFKCLSLIFDKFNNIDIFQKNIYGHNALDIALKLQNDKIVILIKQYMEFISPQLYDTIIDPKCILNIDNDNITNDNVDVTNVDVTNVDVTNDNVDVTNDNVDVTNDNVNKNNIDNDNVTNDNVDVTNDNVDVTNDNVDKKNIDNVDVTNDNVDTTDYTYIALDAEDAEKHMENLQKSQSDINKCIKILLNRNISNIDKIKILEKEPIFKNIDIRNLIKYDNVVPQDVIFQIMNNIKDQHNQNIGQRDISQLMLNVKIIKNSELFNGNFNTSGDDIIVKHLQTGNLIGDIIEIHFKHDPPQEDVNECINNILSNIDSKSDIHDFLSSNYIELPEQTRVNGNINNKTRLNLKNKPKNKCKSRRRKR